MSNDAYIFVIQRSLIKEGFGIEIAIYGVSVALFRHENKIHAVHNQCPHQGAPLDQGFVEEGYIVCPHHRWKFRLSDGAFIANELLKLKTFSVLEDSGNIYLRKDELLKY